MKTNRSAPLSGRLGLLAVATTIAMLAWAVHAAADAGSLDPKFGNHGRVVRDLGQDDEAIASVTRGGNTVVVGDIGDYRQTKVIVSRFKPTGKLDRDFGRRGTRVIPVPGYAYAEDVAITPVGRIVVAFTAVTPHADSGFGLARLRPNGKLDSTFDNDGVQVTGFGTTFNGAVARALAVQPDGNVVEVGYVNSESYSWDLALARYTRDGQLDESFSAGGRQETDVAGTVAFAEAVSLDDDGRIIVTGSAKVSAHDRLMIARYDAAGELDPTFAGDGVLTSDVARSGDDIVALPDGGSIVVGGAADDFMVARFGADGTPDPSFSGDGVQAIDFSDGADKASSVVLAGRRIVVAGKAETPRGHADFAIARLLGDGSLDSSFAQDGRRTPGISRRDDAALDVGIDGKGRVVAAGFATTPKGTADHTDTALVRLLRR